MKKTLLTLMAFAGTLSAFSWGGDVLVGPQATGKSSIVASSNGTLYYSIPVGTTGVGGMKIYSSTDQGQTWMVAGIVPGLFVTKTKMLVTGTDSLYCVYQVDDDLFVYSVAASVSTPFTTLQVSDWDAAASPNSNSIYLFCDAVSSNDLRRYSSIDGGYTWTGSSAQVAGNGAHPRVYMTGTRLILNYYGPVLADTTASIIRGTFYDESAPGQLTTSPGNFQDLITNGLHHQNFMPVRTGNYVWFFYLEGDSAQTFHFMVSTDDGVTYGAPNVVYASPGGNVCAFDACHYFNVVDDGVNVVYVVEESGITQVTYTTSINTSPTFQLFEIVNDYDPQCYADGGQPSITQFGADVGIVMQEDSAFLAAYFDRRLATVGITALDAKKDFILYPNPVETQLNVETNANGIFTIYDFSGRLLKILELDKGENQFDVSFLSVGIYFVETKNGNKLKLVKM